MIIFKLLSCHTFLFVEVLHSLPWVKVPISKVKNELFRAHILSIRRFPGCRYGVFFDTTTGGAKVQIFKFYI